MSSYQDVFAYDHVRTGTRIVRYTNVTLIQEQDLGKFRTEKVWRDVPVGTNFSAAWLDRESNVFYFTVAGKTYFAPVCDHCGSLARMQWSPPPPPRVSKMVAKEEPPSFVL